MQLTSLSIKASNVLKQIRRAVRARDLNLEDLVSADEARQACETLFAATADSDEHGVAARVANDASDAHLQTERSLSNPSFFFFIASCRAFLLSENNQR